ncbi:MAG: DUF134 domain-containing protein [Nanoarchaeota archaeon]|nr:DUF134 domain-containing protein [Nanoarchaeota archaeon]MBU1029708.1 DUF134 domain-containing protein [Nanoarchaeota archaeon]MBU1850113.1 DUF134 domain-containing protein [Nanoarchaeota archaeon]
MVRPHKSRIVEKTPKIDYFKPRGIPLSTLDEVTLTIDEWETLRLSDLEELNQTIAAEKMGFHQSTFQRTLCKARKKITDALINGKAIKIEGGIYKIKQNMQNTLGQKRGIGGPKNCICPNCGYEKKHEPGVPCKEEKCPQCNTFMIRDDALSSNKKNKIKEK